jgi:FAD/FMN-containing dehydrogenase
LSPSSSSPGISFSDLRTGLAGRVIEPGDDGYDEARAVFYGAADSRPSVIVKVANATDVALVVRLARDTGLELAIRSGGHSGAGHGTTDGGIVLDLADMKAIEIDVDGRTVWAETGLTAVELSSAVDAHGLAIGLGDTGSVGIGGITVGGGMVNLASLVGSPADLPDHQPWVDAFAAALRQGDDGAYVNFIGDEGEAGVRQAYPGPTWDRLAEIKRRYDPTNLFRRNQNVAPAADGAPA